MKITKETKTIDWCIKGNISEIDDDLCNDIRLDGNFDIVIPQSSMTDNISKEILDSVSKSVADSIIDILKSHGLNQKEINEK